MFSIFKVGDLKPFEYKIGPKVKYSIFDDLIVINQVLDKIVFFYF